MSVTRDIPRAWIKPRAVMAELLNRGERDDMAFIFLIVACVLVFVAQLPRLSREAFETGEEFLPLMGGTLMAWVFLAPLMFYALAALSRVVARLFGGKGTWYRARLALFWSLLAVSPAMLLHGLTAGFLGPATPQADIVGALVLAAFFWIWLGSLVTAERST
ncbi:MAG: YIP1 family protein [Pseudomonadota bacterium]